MGQRRGRPLLSCARHHQRRHPCALPGLGLHSAPRPSPSSCVQGPALAFHRGCSGTRPTGRQHGHHGGGPGLLEQPFFFEGLEITYVTKKLLRMFQFS